jgi:hypothetical protein
MPQRKAPWYRALHGDKPQPKQRKRIAPVSRGMSVKRRRYMALRVTFLKEHPWCAVYPTKPSRDVHHTKGRKGKNYLNTSTWLAVSRKGHKRIHEILPGLDNLSGPAWATRMGFLGSFNA